MPSRGNGGMTLRPGTDAWYSRVIRERWPITRKGQRNCLQAKPVTYLIAKGFAGDQVREIMITWLTEFECAFDSSIEIAVKELDCCILRTQRDFEAGKIEGVVDHSGKTSSLAMHPTLKSYLGSNAESWKLINSAAEKHSNELSVSLVSGEPKGASANRSLQFVLAVMLHYQYRVTQFGEADTICMTHSQLQEILAKRFNQTIHRKQLYRLADKFISRKDQHGKEKTARVFELLLQTKRGYTGTPSEYRVTGLPSLAWR